VISHRFSPGMQEKSNIIKYAVMSTCPKVIARCVEKS
jgi:hypothetical protein